MDFTLLSRKKTAPPSESVESELQFLKLRKEFGQFLTQQVQEQASALLQLGGDLVMQPSEEMVAALAGAWLVQHLDFEAVGVFGLKEEALTPYAVYPPAKSKLLTPLVSESALLDSLARKQLWIVEELKEEKTLSSLGIGSLYGVPLVSGQNVSGYLILIGNPQSQQIVEDVAVDVSQALFLASTLSKLSEETKKLQELDTIRTSFVSTASHQLRTPLSVVKWIFSVFLSDPELLKMDKQMQMIKQAYSGVERIIDVVNDLLNTTRIQNGKLPCTPQPNSDPNQIIKNVLDDSAPIAESRKLSLELKVAKALPSFSFDPILLREALQNMVNNALDYSKEGGVISIQASVTEKNFELKVIDTGIGIREEDKERIFTPLYRSLDATMLHPDGSGLGLYLAKAIAEAHGGSLSFISKLGEGTEFTFAIPII